MYYQGYAPICLGLEDFYIRRLYLRIQVNVICAFVARFVMLVDRNDAVGNVFS